MFKRLVALMIMLVFSGSVSAAPVDVLRRKANSGDKPKVEQAQQPEIQQAIQDASQDVDAYDAMNWGVGSAVASACCPAGGGLIMIAIANANTPEPLANRLLGKTPVYINQYTTTYIEGVKLKRSTSIITGCLVGSVPVVLLVLSGGGADFSGIDIDVGGCSYFGYGF